MANMNTSVLFLIALCIIGIQSSGVGILHMMNLETGASCLDGSPTGLYHKEGWGNGKDKYIVYFQGGAPCLVGPSSFLSLYLCYQYAQTKMGSSKNWNKTIVFDDYGIQSSNPSNYFYNWNFVYILQCDGALHQGLNEKMKTLHISINGLYNLYISGMKDASHVILSGISGGAKASYYWSDHLGQMLNPEKTKYQVIPDSGYMHQEMYHDWSGIQIMDWSFYTMYNLVNQQAPFPNTACTNANKKAPYKCYMGEYVSRHVKSDTFIIQSMNDPAWIFLALQLGSSCVNPIGYSLANCNQIQLNHIAKFANEMRKSITNHLETVPFRRGAWITSCPGHVFTLLPPFDSQDYQVPENSGNTLSQTIVRFVQGSDNNTQLIDPDVYPNNKRCADYDLDMDFPDLQMVNYGENSFK